MKERTFDAMILYFTIWVIPRFIMCAGNAWVKALKAKMRACAQGQFVVIKARKGQRYFAALQRLLHEC